MRELEPGRGVLRRNDKKTEKWHSDLKGRINLNGTIHWLDCYVHQFDDGSRVFNVKVGDVVQAKYQRDAQAQSAPQGAPIGGQPAPVQVDTVTVVLPNGQHGPMDRAVAKQLGLQIVEGAQSYAQASGKADFDDDIPF